VSVAEGSSAIVIQIERLRPLIGRWWERTPAAAHGMPPHLTLLVPWRSPPLSDLDLRELLSRVEMAFPGTPPYGGLFAEQIPHVTVATVESGPLEGLEREIGDALRSSLPFVELVSEVCVVEKSAGSGSRWRVRTRIPLG
jgi:hypothetical protein